MSDSNDTNKQQDSQKKNSATPTPDFITSIITGLIKEKLKMPTSDDMVKMMKQESAQVVSEVITEVLTNPEWKNLKNVKGDDVSNLLKRHGVKKVLEVGQAMFHERFSSKNDTKTPETTSAATSTATNNTGNNTTTPTQSENLGATQSVAAPAAITPMTPTSTLNENTNFTQFLSYIINNPAYKDGFSDGGIVSFIATQCASEDCVIGRAPKWEKVIQQSRLLASSGLDKKSVQRLSAQFVESLFDKETAQLFKEHFGLTPKPQPVVAAKTPAKPRARKAKP